MKAGALDWLVKVAIVTAALAGIAAFAGAGRAVAATQAAASETPSGAVILFASASLIAVRHVLRRRDRVIQTFELSPARRVMAVSNARCQSRRSA